MVTTIRNMASSLTMCLNFKRIGIFGWYGLTFFFIKGTLWLIIPYLVYIIG